MNVEGRKTGIDVVGTVPWGTHFCQLYRTGEDLIDLLVPYFQAGLENNEFCVWITSEPLSHEQAFRVLKRKVKDLGEYFSKDQIEILDHTQWYTKTGRFDGEKVLANCIEMEKRALERGFDGLRMTGNASWLTKSDWKQFTGYEAAANKLRSNHRVLAVCSYWLDKCSVSDILDVVSNHEFALIRQDKRWRIIQSSESQRAYEALRSSERRYALLQRAANVGGWDWEIETGALRWSDSIEPLFGFARGHFGATYKAFLNCVHPDDRQYVIDSVNACVEGGDDYAIEHRIVWPDGTIRWMSETGDVIRDGTGRAVRMLGVVQDITDYKAWRDHERLAGQILRCLNRGGSGPELVRGVVRLIKKAIGFDAVAIRQREGEDFPYLAVDGFSEDFVASENYLCSRDESGRIIYDSQGRPVIECFCGCVLRGRTDTLLPFFTEGGSFWINSTSELPASLRQLLGIPTRNTCNQAGYESVALIRLRSGDDIVGLLQLNDSRRGRFTFEMIRSLEEIGESIGIGMARARAEREIENLAKFPSENPNPVLRISSDGTILYANAAGSRLVASWGCKTGEQVPETWRRYVAGILESGQNEALETFCDDRILSLIMTPVKDGGYANVYGSDVTERRRAEEDLRQYRDHLEELVQNRTAELTRANEKLMREIEGRKRLEQEILNISEREQRRIGRELHDSIGQQFTGIAFMMKVLEQKLAGKLPDEANDAGQIKKLVNQAMDQMRGLAKGLHPVDLDAGSLMAALHELAATTEKLFGVHCVLRDDGRVVINDAEVATHLYRITQEAITNAIKHGNAGDIRIELACRDSETVLTVANDGVDFPEEAETRGTGMGLQIMDHRADIIGASLSIRRGPQSGTILTCSLRRHRQPLGKGKS